MTAHKPSGGWRELVENLGLMVSRPAALQYGALCYRVKADEPTFLLITSRETGRWIIPKGWAVKNLSDAGSAEQEAFEEAGAVGHICASPLGTYRYQKWMQGGFPVECDVRVYAMAVERLEDEYPEADQRQRRWFRRDDAVCRIDEPQLQDLVADFSP